MSDSLNETLIVSVPVFTISAKFELLEDELELLELPALPELVVLALPDELDPELLLLVPPADTESPGEMLASETTVPSVGENSLVSASVVFALRTLSSALYTDACAVAMLAAEDVVVVDPPLDEPLAPPVVDPPVVVLGAAGAAVVVGPVVVAAGVVVVVVVLVVVVGVVAAGVGVVLAGMVVVLAGVVVTSFR